MYKIDDPHWYVFPYRTNFELYTFFLWFFSGLVIYFAPFFIDAPVGVYSFLGLINIFCSFYFGFEGFEIFIRKRNIKGYPLTFLDPKSDYVLDRFQLFDKEVRDRVQKKEN